MARCKPGDSLRSSKDPTKSATIFPALHTVYEANDVEADKIYDRTVDSRRCTRLKAHSGAELAKHRAERPRLQQQFSYLKRGLAVVVISEWEVLEIRQTEPMNGQM